MNKIKLIYKQVIGLMICISILILYRFDLINLGDLCNRYFYCGSSHATGFAAFPDNAWVDFSVMFVAYAVGSLLLVNILFKFAPKVKGK